MRARISSYGGGRYIFYVPKELRRKTRELYEKRRELVVIVYELETLRF